MEQPDKELWDKLKLSPAKYAYIKLPAWITKHLKRQVGKDTLMFYSVIENGEKKYLLHYVCYEETFARPKAGYCFEVYNGQPLKEKLEIVVRDIAETWPEYAVKHRKQK